MRERYPRLRDSATQRLLDLGRVGQGLDPVCLAAAHAPDLDAGHTHAAAGLGPPLDVREHDDRLALFDELVWAHVEALEVLSDLPKRLERGVLALVHARHGNAVGVRAFPPDVV